MDIDYSHNPTRRHLLAAGISIAFFPIRAAARGAPLKISLLGQSLIKTDLRLLGWAGLGDFRRLLRDSDAVFTDLETVISGPLAGPSTRAADSEVLHVADPAVIKCLQAIGVNIVATSNNHAWDLNSGGILSTIDAVKKRGLTYAGTGEDLAGASSAGYLRGRHTVALVAAAAGAIREGAAATASRPGVNELRRGVDGALDPVDVDRYLGAIRLAAQAGAVVIAYVHNHYWEPLKSDTPIWQRDLARRAVDAGAVAFAAHGVPEIQGVEYYRGAPLFHGLGSFIFQSVKSDDSYGPEAWQSMLAQIEITDRSVRRTKLIPVQLNAQGVVHHGALVRGTPALASGEQAHMINNRIAALSGKLGSSVKFQAPARNDKSKSDASVILIPA